MPRGKKRKDKLDICNDCEKAARPAISAARLGHTNCLATAYRNLGVFNERDDYGATPIHYAARNGRLECLQWLVTRSGISPNAASNNGATAAHDAAAMGHLECLKYLLQTTRCTAKDSTVEGATVLHMACRFGRLDAVQWLIECAGSDPSEKGANDVTPVHLCAAKNHLECLKWLTQHPNYVPNERTVHGATAVYFAAQEGSLECLEWLVKHGSGDAFLTATDGMSPVHAAAQAGQISCMEWLVSKAGVSPRYKAEDGATPAHFAAASGQVECLNWILDNGGSVLDRDNLGGTPVHDAAEQGQVGTLSVLIQHGVDVMAADNDGLRPLDLAQDNNHEDCIQLLFKTLRPNLLTSLTPHHSLSRASAAGEDDEQVKLQAEKQRQFEEAMMEGVSEARMSAMWESAQKSAPTGLQPGLIQILSGEEPVSASQFSLDRTSMTPLVPTGSRRHSRHSTLRSTQRSAVGSKRSTSADEGFKENLTQYKPRPALSPDLFLHPQGGEGGGGGDGDLRPTTKKARTDDSLTPEGKPGPPASHLRPIQDLLNGVAPSPIPHRAKFLKKFNLSKKAKGGAPKVPKAGKKDKKKKNLADKKEEGSAVKAKLPVAAATATAVNSETTAVIVTDESSQPMDTQLATARQEVTPTAMEQEKATPTAMEQEATPSAKERVTTPTGKEQGATPTGMEQGATPTGIEQEATPTAMEQEPASSSVKPEPTPKLEPAPCDVVAESVVSRALQETIQGTVTPPPEIPAPNRPVTPPPPVQVVLRKKEKRKKEKAKAKKRASYEEQAVIVKQRGSRSLQNPEETVTVSFLPKTSNVKKPFPVTHTKLLSDADLSSPGSSDDEETGRESFTTPGFVRLDQQTFEQFGLDVKAIDQLREEEAKEWKELDDASQETDSTLREDEPSGDSVKKLDFDVKRETTTLPATAVHKPKSPLAKWRNIHSLNKIDGLVDCDSESVSSDDTFIIHADREAQTVEEYGSRAVYSKMPDKQREQEGKSSEVAKLVGRIETQKKSTAGADSQEKAPAFAGVVRSGSVSEKLKMFGGGSAKSEAKEKAVMEPRKQQAKALKEKQRALGEKMRAAGLVEETDTSPVPQPVLGLMKPESVPAAGSRPKSTSAFEPIREETGSSSEKEEEDDRVAPLPKIHPGLGRRHSQELLKLDGLTPAQEARAQQSKPAAKKTTSLKQPISCTKQASSEEKAPVSPVMRKKKSASAIYSPLMISSEASRREDRPKSSPQNAKSLTLYMNSANLPHLNYLRERYVKDETEHAEEVAGGLLKSVWDKGSKVPVEFRGLEVGARERMYIWRQKAGSLNKVTSLEAVTFDPNSVFIFLKCYPWGPLLSRIFLWVGGAVGSFAIHSSYQHCQCLVACTPGRPVLHREFQGHESFLFCEAVGGELMARHERSLQYLNTALYKTRLHSVDLKTSSFTEVSSPLTHTTITGDAPLVLDTPTQVFLWLPMSYWEGKEERKTALEISELFISSQSYPKWTPVTVVTEQAEPPAFSTHFPSWPSPNLALSSRARELGLPKVRAPEVTYPATGQTKIWYIQRGMVHEIPLDRIGHFDSDRIYLIQYNYRKQSSLYTWLECVLYVWVGQDEGGGERSLQEAIASTASIGPIKQVPLVLVPEGKEPEQLLNLFKGRFIIHRKKAGSVGGAKDGVQLFQISGTAALRMRAVEVPPVSASLHSSHAFLLRAGEKLFSWSGQFSSQAERRGALIIAKLMGSKSEPTKLAEGMETPDFWNLLKGKGRYQHFTAPEYPAYSVPVFYSCRIESGTGGVVFTQTPPKKKEELQSNRSYLVEFKDKLFLWLGRQCEEVSPPDIIKSYIHQYHSWKRSHDFLVTVVWESHEGEAFWKWFNGLQNVSLETTPPAPPTEEEGEEEIEELVLTRVDDEIEEVDGVEGDGVQGASVQGDGVKGDGVQGDDVEDGKDEVSSVAKDAEVTLRAPPTSQLLPLTQSQEPVFAKTEQLRVDSEAPVEGGGEEEGQTATVAPLTNGLDSVLDDVISKKPGPTKPDKPATDTSQTGLASQLASEASATDDSPIPTPPEITSEVNLLEKLQDDKRKPKKTASKPPKMVVVPVEVEGRGVCEVTVKEAAPVISVMFKVAETAGVKLTTNSAIIEISDSLRIQRALEDHELIRDVITAWPSKNKPRLLLQEAADKYSLWTSTPPIPKPAITAFLKQGKVPELAAQFQHCRRGNKLQWIQGTFCLRHLGICTVDTKRPGELSAGQDLNLYTPLATRGRGISSPTPFCFIMKPASSWKEKDMKLYSALDHHTMKQWTHTLRLIKYGLQLKGNYIAMKNRLQKRPDLQRQETRL